MISCEICMESILPDVNYSTVVTHMKLSLVCNSSCNRFMQFAVDIDISYYVNLALPVVAYSMLACLCDTCVLISTRRSRDDEQLMS